MPSARRSARNLVRIALGVAVAGALASLVSLAVAETKTHAPAGITMWVPDTWKSATKDGVLTLTDPDEEIAFIFRVLPKDDLKDAITKLDAELAKFVSDITVTEKAKEKDLNGMKALTIDAKGKVEGVPVDVGVIIVKTPTKKALLVLGIVESAKMEKHKPMIKEIFMSLKPI